MTLQTVSFRARPSVMVAALAVLHSENPPPTMAGDPKATCFDKPPRDLSDVYTSAVCVKVPDFKCDDTAMMTTAMNLLTGSTMNGQVLTEGDAHKLLADKKVAGAKKSEVRWGAGKKLDPVAVLTHDLGLLREAHHGVQVGITDVPVRTEGPDRAMHHVH